MKNLEKKAFTLIELLVVIAIIGILATLAVVALQQARQSARDGKRVSDIKQLHTTLELFYNENNRYPTNEEWSSGSIVSNSGNFYMSEIPSAPIPADGECLDISNTYKYLPSGDGSTYTMSFCTGKKVSNLPGGEKCLTPGGVIADNCSDYLIDEGLLIPEYNSYEVFFEFEKDVVDVVSVGNDLIFIDTDSQLWKYSNGEYLLLHVADPRLGLARGLGYSGHSIVYIQDRLFTFGDTKLSEINMNTWEIDTIMSGSDNRFSHSAISWNGNLIFAYIGGVSSIDTLERLFRSDTYVTLSSLDDVVNGDRLWLPGYGIRYGEGTTVTNFTSVEENVFSQHRFIVEFNEDLYCIYQSSVYRYDNVNDVWVLSVLPAGIRQIAVIGSGLHSIGGDGIYNINGDVLYSFSSTATTGKFLTHNGEIIVFADNKLLRPIK